MSSLTDLRRQLIRERTRAYTRMVILITVIVTLLVIWSLSTLLLPIVFGTLLAYICLPVVASISRAGIPRFISVLLLVLFLFTGLFYAVIFVTNQLPDRAQQLQLRVTAIHQLNERYQNLMQIGSNHESSYWAHEFLGAETDPFMDSINLVLAFNQREEQLFIESLEISDITFSQRQRLLNYFDSYRALNMYASDEMLHEVAATQSIRFFNRIPDSDPDAQAASTITTLFSIFSTWLLMPVFFFFFLIDKGNSIKKIVNAVPNMFFEMTLTSIQNVDKAIGMYLRGTVLECFAVFACFMILLLLIGFSITAALLISLASAIFNIVPIAGPAVGIILCFVFALIIDDVNSLIPYVDANNIVVFATLGALFVQLIDNTLLKPYILGSATDLHPILVFVAAIGGGVMFGFWGVLFAIPVVVIVKVSALTIHERLKMYQIISY